jgi:N utilization substance protein B
MATRVEKMSGQLHRSAARLAAVQALYEIDVAEAHPDTVLDDFLLERWPGAGAAQQLPRPDLVLLSRIVHGVRSDLGDLDSAIGKVVGPSRSLDRMEPLLRSIVRAGGYELKEIPENPAKVIINEYINLAHAFFSGGEPAFINAVLDRLTTHFRDEKPSKPE